MKLTYDKAYFDNYYDGPYDQTFQYGFHLENILSSCWDRVFDKRPTSFADIGSGPGHTLKVAGQLLPNVRSYGVECQDIPKKDIVHPNVIIGDFVEISKTLQPVDLLYCACSMYIPWEETAYFIKEVLRLSNKAVCFANVYLSDKQGIPEDTQRKVIYKSRKSFTEGIESFGGWKAVAGPYDFFYKPS